MEWFIIIWLYVAGSGIFGRWVILELGYQPRNKWRFVAVTVLWPLVAFFIVVYCLASSFTDMVRGR